MRVFFFIYTLLATTFLNAQLLPSLPNHLTKRLLIANPTTANLEALYALHQSKLLDLETIQFIGIYHKNENYDYSKSVAVLDTMSCINMELFKLTEPLHKDSLFCNNSCTPIFDSLFTESEGAIFFGGPDIPPSLYGEKPHTTTRVTDPFRHYFEASFLFHLLGGYQDHSYEALLEANPNYLIFGICLGMQTMNIASGGTLIQDIPSELFNSNESAGLQHLNNEEIHRNYYPKMSSYRKKGLTGSHFHKIIFKDYFFPDFVKISMSIQPMVNSYHHQAVEKLGKGFKVSATSSDGKVIEAIFHSHYQNVFGVQFHPERSQLYLRSKKYKFTPQGKIQHLPEFIDEESMEFHFSFWRAINDLIQKL